ncbi:MAG TPA: ABC transporter permease subunit [Chloroflexota bacterium]|nr:ABC transporter permease subunit [Chloroflexota bacterium]
MPGLIAVFRKEMADNFASKRFLIMFALILLAGMSATYTAAQAIRTAVSGSSSGSVSFVFLLLFTVSDGMLPSFISFISFLGPLVGLSMGFDAINGEYARGTLSRVLSHPIFRDAVINGKFLARLATIAVMLVCISMVLAGLGLRLIGVPPTADEIFRLLLYMGISIVYVAFWMSLAILFSILFRQATTSALAGIAVWIFFTFFMGMIAGVAAQAIAPVNQQDPQTVIDQVHASQAIARLSPGTLYQEITSIILDPSSRTLSPVVMASEQQGMVAGILPLGQSLLLVWPHIVALIAETVICFAISYVKFMRQEIRA